MHNVAQKETVFNYIHLRDTILTNCPNADPYSVQRGILCGYVDTYQGSKIKLTKKSFSLRLIKTMVAFNLFNEIACLVSK